MSCYNCGGRGEIVVCFDDLCRGADECIHGDGMAVCPVCKGADYTDDDYEEEPIEAAERQGE